MSKNVLVAVTIGFAAALAGAAVLSTQVERETRASREDSRSNRREDSRSNRTRV
jgi:hypothetical protein